MGLLTNLSLFSGAGGLDLGARLVGGFRTVCYVERDLYAQASLMSRIRDGSLDDAPIWDDITTFDGRPFRGLVNVISGGFPCQDISIAGKRAGIRGGQEVGFGKSLPASFAKWDPKESCWKTCQLSFLTETLESYLETWPSWGLMLNGGAFQPQDLEPIFTESDGSFVDGKRIPRPVAVDGKGSGRLRVERGANNNLRDYFNINGGWMCPPVQVSEYLMGWSLDHTALDSAATAWFLSKQRRRGKGSRT